MTHPLVSVIIPTYNRAALLLETIASVRDQTCADHEIIVVDDGSTDDTAVQVRKKYSSQVTYLRQERAGVSAARNLGIAKARGAWMAFLDSDDLWHPAKLARQLAFLEDHPDISVCYCDYRFTDLDGTLIEPSNLQAPVERMELFRQFLSGCPVHPCTVLIRSSSLGSENRFDRALSYGEDWDLLARLADRLEFGFVPGILVDIRKHSTNVTALHVEARVRDHLRVIDRVFSLPSAASHCRLRSKIKAEYALQAAHGLLKNGQFSAARVWLFRALQHSPWHSRGWKSLIRTFVPRPGRSV